MKIMLGQIRPISCGFAENVGQIQDGIIRAAKTGCTFVAFPESCIPGTLTLDRKYQSGYIDANLRAVQNIIEFTRAVGPNKPYVIVGYDDRNHNGSGRPFKNKAALIRNGILLGTYEKQLISSGEYYEPGKSPFVWTMDGQQWGLLIGEDWWNDKEQGNYDYATNPFARLKAMGVKNFVSINSSLFHYARSHRRVMVAKEICPHSTNFVFVNQRGGMDNMVFDGHSFIMNGSSLSYIALETATPLYDVQELASSRYLQYEPDVIREMYDCIVMATRDYIHDNGFEEVVVGSSGGIDSAVTLKIACDAIGPENVHGVRMRSLGRTDGAADTDAIELHKRLNCHDHCIPLDADAVIALIHTNQEMGNNWNQVADENIQAQLRADILSYLSNAFGWLILCTSNKSEAAAGYGTLRGDISGGFAPLIDVLKGEVYQIAALAKNQIPDNIVRKRPSAQLRPLVDGNVAQFDEDALLPYPILDTIVEAYGSCRISTFDAFTHWVWRRANPPKEHWEREKLPKERPIHPIIVKWLKETSSRADYERIIKQFDRSEYKRRQAPLGPQVNQITFGSGQLIPLTKRGF